MEYIIRPMDQSDWPQIVEVLYQSIQTNNETFLLDCPAYAEWDAMHARDCRLVIADDYGLVGWSALSPISSLDAFKGAAQVSIYLDAEHKDCGFGSELLSALVKDSEKAGYWLLEANVFESNHAALALHEKCGFRKVGVRERIAKDRFGVWRSVVLMERRIQTDKAGGCDCDMIKKMQSHSCQ